MLRQILKIFFRNLSKHWFISAINFFGLAIGMVAFFLIFHYVKYERSFDGFHSKSDRTFRVIMTREIAGEVVDKGPDTYPAMLSVIRDNYPGVEAIEKLMFSPNSDLMSFQIGDQKLLKDDLKSVSVSPEFFKIFDVEVLYGNPEELKDPFKIMVSESLVDNIYQGKNPTGQLIQKSDGLNYEIIGVYKKWEGNSHLDFDMIFSFVSLGARLNSTVPETSWDWPRMKTYITLEEGTDVSEFESRVYNVINEYKPLPEGVDLKETITLQPLRDIRLKSDFLANGPFDQANVKITVFMMLGFLILIMAWINYTNLSIAHGLDRIKESGIKKVLGASKGFIMRQHLVESLFINVLAGLMALSLYQILLPSLHAFAEIPGSYTDGFGFYVIVVLGLITGSVISGLYPAVVLSRLNVVLALKKKVSSLGKGVTGLRNALTATQFAVSLSLLIIILAVYQQLGHLKSLDPGTKIEGVLVVKQPRNFDYDAFSAQPDVIKNEWKRISGVEQVASSYAVPGGNIYPYSIRQVGEPIGANVSIHSHQVDHSFMDLYDLEFIAGRGFSRSIMSDDSASVLTESAMRLLGFATPEEALNSLITTPMDGYYRHVIGVVKDYNQLSAHSPRQPISFSLDTESRGYYSIAFSAENLSSLVDQVEETFSQVFPGNIFHSFFLDDYYNEQFRREEQLSKLLTFFTLIAIILASMGLVSITFFTVLRRMKEMSIRKVLGAQFRNLLGLFSRDGSLSFLVASMIAIPLSYYLITKWLESFDSRINVGVELFSIPLFILYALALLVMLLVVVKAVRANPINALREE